eukprot:TRINITY_DN2278_c0_g1_i1.p1 TRINITY_DN2278_c0_g1~~TRINITY_DN2278_c0_g1_i1.p1  ORF type:complete len:812 (+),score=167.21 TRINITY_DN2278_c0_g1_i1:67-2502(+)
MSNSIQTNSLNWVWQPLLPNPTLTQILPSPRCGSTASILRNNELLVAFGDSGKVVSGRTYFNDTFIYDTKKTSWSKVDVVVPPNTFIYPRSHHSACCFKDRGILYFGGKDDKQYYDETLFLGINNSTEQLEWRQIFTTEPRPSPRRGHTTSVLSTGNCLLFGGDAAGKLVEDLWLFDTTKLQWVQIPARGSVSPGGRIFHTAVVDSRDSLIVFGGDMEQRSTSLYMFDLRSNTWNKLATGTSSQPLPWRYGHTAHLDANNTMLIYGGCDKEASVYTSDFQKISAECILVNCDCTWNVFPITGTFKPEGRVYHSSIMAGNQLVLFGGWKPSTQQATNSLWHLYATPATTTAAQSPTPAQPPAVLPPSSSDKALVEMELTAEARAAVTLEGPSNSKVKLAKKAIFTEARKSFHPPKMYRANSITAYQGKAIEKVKDMNPALLALTESTEVPIAGKKKSGADLTKEVAHFVMEVLLYESWFPTDDNSFILDSAQILALCSGAVNIFLEQETCVSVSAPAKVFGDIHGQFPDLLEFFNAYGSPNHRTGDIQLTNYVFIGDFVDRGMYSLEVITLLLALKVRYPKEIWLIRGNHEDESINSKFGFLKECETRFGQEEGQKVWLAFNNVFETLPLSAIIEDKILCIHGGLGPTLTNINQLKTIKRPVKVSTRTQSEEATLLYDLLWSDPTDNDEIMGFRDNIERGGGCMKFGPEKVWEFCKSNAIDLVIRAHQPVLEGYEYFASGNLVTVFSATNYCGEYGNSGALLAIDKKLHVTPKVIRPLSSQPKQSAGINATVPQTWQTTQHRPATPLRRRKQ